MKKTYSTPALKVVNVKIQHLMAGSGPDTVNLSIDGGEITGGDQIGTKDSEDLWED